MNCHGRYPVPWKYRLSRKGVSALERVATRASHSRARPFRPRQPRGRARTPWRAPLLRLPRGRLGAAASGSWGSGRTWTRQRGDSRHSAAADVAVPADYSRREDMTCGQGGDHARGAPRRAAIEHGSAAQARGPGQGVAALRGRSRVRARRGGGCRGVRYRHGRGVHAPRSRPPLRTRPRAPRPWRSLQSLITRARSPRLFFWRSTVLRETPTAATG